MCRLIDRFPLPPVVPPIGDISLTHVMRLAAHSTFAMGQSFIMTCSSSTFIHNEVYQCEIHSKTAKRQNFMKYVLFRTRNLGQHFFDISKKNDVNQPLVSLINDSY
jgi:hypothetical protein